MAGCTRILATIGATFAVLATVLVGAAGLATSASAESGVPLPQVSRGKGDQCVEDTAFMRRNHMKMLHHQRDETMHNGIRTKQFSLKECIDCHAVPGTDGQPVKVSDPKHFCRSCHDYAAVKVDCFECHASTPEASGQAANEAMPDHSDVAALAEYLGKVGQ